MRRRPSNSGKWCSGRRATTSVVRVALLAGILVASACGGSASGRGEAVVDVRVPDPALDDQAPRALEPVPTPEPTPTPVTSPTPTPGPTPTPLPPPKAASLRTSGGTQRGAPARYCWTPVRGGPSDCYDHPPPSQPTKLRVRSGEVGLLQIDAVRAPNEQNVRAFQGSRAGYPANRIEPALRTDLTIDLPEGTWSLDVCATWYGHGEPICWLFVLDVVQPAATQGP